MESISKIAKIEKIPETLKTKVLAILNDVKAQAYQHIDKNPDQEVADVSGIEEPLQKGLKQLIEGALKFLLDKEPWKAFERSTKPKLVHRLRRKWKDYCILCCEALRNFNYPNDRFCLRID